MPREGKFFDLFAQMSQNLTHSAKLLADILDDMQNVEARMRQLHDMEHIGDDITHQVLTKLNQTFITPFDREDIHTLATSLDDVLDFIHAAGERLIMYKITTAPPAAEELAQIIVKQAEELAHGVKNLEKHDHVLEHCVEINRLENEADQVARDSIAKLFEREKDPISLIKLKELYEVLETATDKAEDVANVLESIVVKNA
jgi:predicted phosphate transport protein (TIGR00153 family)